MQVRSMSRGLVVALVAGVLQLTGMSQPALAAAPAAPTGLSPSGGSTSGQPVLQWNRVAGAAEYEVQVDDVSDFGDPLYEVTTDNRRATPIAPLPQSELFWRVRGVTSSGAVGRWASASFTGATIGGPTLLSPVGGEDLQQPDEPALLSWSPVAKATSYTIEVDDDEQFVAATSYTSKTTAFLLQDPGPQTTYYWRVRASFAGSFSTLWSEGESFRVLALATPVLRAPANSPSTTVRDAVLDWLPVPGAVSYQVQVSADSQFNAIVDDAQTVHATQYARSKTYANNQYWWRVRAKDVNGNLSPWSADLFTFERDWPQQASLIHPTQGSTSSRPLYFEWSPVQHASHYELQVGTNANFSPTTYSTCFTRATTYTPGFYRDACHLAPGNVYYWRVRGIDAPASPAVLGRWSEPGTFTYQPGLVQQMSPADGATVAVPTLTWDRFGEAMRYEVSVYDAGGSKVASTSTYSTSWTPTTRALDPNDAPFAWSVAAVDRSGVKSQVIARGFERSFAISGTAPETPAPALTPLSPAAGSTSTRFPSLTWEPIGGDTVEYYRVFVRVGANLAELGEKFPYSAATDETATFLEPGTYPWFVRAYDDADRLVGTGSESSFTIADLGSVQNERLSLTGEGLTNPPSTCTRQLSDVDNPVCVNLQQTPLLRWDPVPWASHYMVYVAQDEALTNLVYNPLTSDEAVTVNTMWTPRNQLPDSQAGKAYFWVVRPCKTTTICAPDPTAATQAFDKKSNPVSGLTEREHDSTVPLPGSEPEFADEVVLSWDPYVSTNQASNTLDVTTLPSTVEAESYRVQISTDRTFSTSNTHTSGLLDQTTFTPWDELLPEGPLFWRVQAVDGSDNALAWSLSRNITSATETIKKDSPTPHLTFPVDGVSVSGTPSFTWDPLAYAAKYTIEVYKNNDRTFSIANRVVSDSTEQAAYALDDKILAPSSLAYVWRVRRTDVDNNVGGWSAPRTFTVKGNPPTLVSPSSSAYVSAKDSYFTWRAVDGATSYEIEIKSSSGSITDETTVGLSWAPTSTFSDGSRQWRVLAYDASRNVLGTSVWRPFKVDSLAPTVVKKSPTRNPARAANFVATFSEPVTGVSTTTMRLYVKGQQHNLSAQVTLTNGGKTGTLNPKVNLRPGRYYTVKLLGSIRDRGKNVLRATSWTVRAK